MNLRDIAGEHRRRRIVNLRDIAGEHRRRRIVNLRDIAGEHRIQRRSGAFFVPQSSLLP